MKITVVLNGADNDKEVFQTAARLAAREGTSLRVELGPGCSRESFEKHLHFVLWDVRERLRLPGPRIDIVSRMETFNLETEEASTRLAPSQKERLG